MELKDKPVSLKLLLCLFSADIDIFLLQNKEQTVDNDRESFNREEIRENISKSLKKTLNVLSGLGYDIDKPI
jgi:hypothetical protein